MNNFFYRHTCSQAHSEGWVVFLSKKYCHNIVKFHIFVIIILFSSCKTNKKIVTNGVSRPLAKQTTSFLQTQHTNNQILFNSFIGKAKIKYKTKDELINFQLLIRMQKDSAIYCSLTKMGFEGARVLISPDSVHILDRQNKIYYGREFSFLKENYGLPIDFYELQNIIVGNISLKNAPIKSGIIGNEYWLRDKSYKLFLHPDTYLSTKIEYEQENMRMIAYLKDYRSVETLQRPFAFRQIIEINTDREEQISVDIDYSDISFSKLIKISFYIPENYEKN